MSDHLADVLRQAVRAERARDGLSQAQLAAALGWSRQAVSALETGTRRLAADELPDLCRALRVTLPDLLVRATAEDRAVLNPPEP